MGKPTLIITGASRGIGAARQRGVPVSMVQHCC